MKHVTPTFKLPYALLLVCLFALAAACNSTETKAPAFTLTKTDKFLFNSFVDCNMAEVWVGDTFRIFPGKYGEDTLHRGEPPGGAGEGQRATLK